MKIFSWHGREISKQTWVKLLEEVRKTKGTVVLPLREMDLSAARAIASKPSEIRKITDSNYPSMYLAHLAAVAISEGRNIVPLFDSGFFQSNVSLVDQSKAKLRHGATGEWEEFAMRLPDLIGDSQMEYTFQRFKKNRPHLLFAEDNQARVLGRLFRVKVNKLTADSDGVNTLIKKSTGRLLERFRGKPKPQKRK